MPSAWPESWIPATEVSSKKKHYGRRNICLKHPLLAKRDTSAVFNATKKQKRWSIVERFILSWVVIIVSNSPLQVILIFKSLYPVRLTRWSLQRPAREKLSLAKLPDEILLWMPVEHGRWMPVKSTRDKKVIPGTGAERSSLSEIAAVGCSFNLKMNRCLVATGAFSSKSMHMHNTPQSINYFHVVFLLVFFKASLICAGLLALITLSATLVLCAT